MELRKAAMAIDPLANRSGIEVHQGAGGGLVDNPETEKAAVGGVKAEYRFGCDANPIMRHDAKHHGAGGRAGAVNDDAVAGVANCHEARPIGANIAALVVGDADDGRRRPRQRRKKRSTASHSDAIGDFGKAEPPVRATANWPTTEGRKSADHGLMGAPEPFGDCDASYIPR